MSLMRCHRCGWMVNSDDDPEAIQPYPSHPVRGAPDICLCEKCREPDFLLHAAKSHDALVAQVKYLENGMLELTHIYMDRSNETAAQKRALLEDNERLRKVTDAFRNADNLDWEHLFKMLPESGHGKFWKAVFREVQSALSKPTPDGSKT